VFTRNASGKGAEKLGKMRDFEEWGAGMLIISGDFHSGEARPVLSGGDCVYALAPAAIDLLTSSPDGNSCHVKSVRSSFSESRSV
jgi:hypothetical protein